jgi:methionyl-tRNA formyltransferase
MATQEAGGLRAVFVTDLSPVAAHAMASWLQAGHQVAACVQSHRPRTSQWRRDRLRAVFAPSASLQRICRKHRIPILIAPRDLRDPVFAARLGGLQADVLISIGFQHRIPAQMTSACRCGGVNLHPSMLPEYRGPQPMPAMAVDGAVERCAGVTMHTISEGFDEGDIIAQQATHISGPHDIQWHQLWFARIGAALLIHELPQFCDGRLQPRPQPHGEWRYARLAPADRLMTPELGRKALENRSHVLGPKGKLRLVLDGRTYAVAGVMRSATQPTGQPPRITWRAVEFDTADARVWLARSGRIQRRLRTIEEFRLWRRLSK